MTKITLTDSAAKAVVKAGTIQTTKAVQKVSRIQDSPSMQIEDDIRPARLQSAWTQNASGVWNATACFIVNDVADTSNVFPVYAPTATANPGGTAEVTRFFIVWRERWEMIAGVGGTTPSLSVTKGAFVSDISATTGTITLPAASYHGSITPEGNVVLKLNGTEGTINVVTDITAQNGVLGVETKTLTATFGGSQTAITMTSPTTTETIVTGLNLTKTQAVTDCSIS